MNTQTIDHTTLSRLAEAGAVRSAHIVGQAGGWGILVKYGMTERALAAQRSQQVRIFRKFETLVTYLKGVGIARFEVDAVNYDAASLKLTRTRPDSAEAMKKAHEAVAYDKWFRGQVQEAIDDPRPPIPHKQVMVEMRALIETKRKQRAGS
ncbi:MAG: hypothetical protein ABL885_12655 [Methylophilaceae bacterium]